MFLAWYTGSCDIVCIYFKQEREKRLKKKERKKVAGSAPADDVSEEEITPSSLTPTETPKELETKEKVESAAKRPQKPTHFTKQTKVKSTIPPPLRNRGKRKMQLWMWVILVAAVVLALFLAGNSSKSLGRWKDLGFIRGNSFRVIPQWLIFWGLIGRFPNIEYTGYYHYTGYGDSLCSSWEGVFILFPPFFSYRLGFLGFSISCSCLIHSRVSSVGLVSPLSLVKHRKFPNRQY